MDIELLTTDRATALEKWREYKDALKKTRDPLYDDMKKVYNQIKNGKQVVDIFDAIRCGSIHPSNCHPKLAIAPANKKEVFCRYQSNGDVFYSPVSHWRRRWGRVGQGEIELVDCLPRITMELDLKAPIPIIPPRLRPANLTNDYWILWEVDHWTPMPSKDPYLLKRLTKTLFVVCAAWDLTDIEMKIIASRTTKAS